MKSGIQNVENLGDNMLSHYKTIDDQIQDEKLKQAKLETKMLELQLQRMQTDKTDIKFPENFMWYINKPKYSEITVDCADAIMNPLSFNDFGDEILIDYNNLSK